MIDKRCLSEHARADEIWSRCIVSQVLKRGI
jgi:hypothetical protein